MRAACWALRACYNKRRWIPDLLGTVGTQAQNQTLYKAPLYDLRATSNRSGSRLMYRSSCRSRTTFRPTMCHDVIAHIKANAAKLSFGSPGAGSVERSCLRAVQCGDRS